MFDLSTVYPIDGVAMMRPPKPGAQAVVNGAHHVLALNTDGDVGPGRVYRADKAPGQTHHYRTIGGDREYARYFRGAVINPPVKAGDVVMLLGVPGFEDRGGAWMVARANQPPRRRNPGVHAWLENTTPLWGPDGHPRAGRMRTISPTPYGDAWVRLVAEPPAQFLPVQDEDPALAALRAEGRTKWLRWARAWQWLRHAANERMWDADLRDIAEQVGYVRPESDLWSVTVGTTVAADGGRATIEAEAARLESLGLDVTSVRATSEVDVPLIVAASSPGGARDRVETNPALLTAELTARGLALVRDATVRVRYVYPY